MSILLSGLDLIEEQLGDERTPLQEIQKAIQDLKIPCATGINLLNELLDFEKLSSGLQVLDRSAQDPFEFIELTVTPFLLVAQNKHLTLECQYNIRRSTISVNVDEAKVFIIYL